MHLLTLITYVFTAAAALGAGAVLIFNPRLVLLIFKNLGRNLLRTSLTAMAIVVLAVMITLIWTIVSMLDQTMEEQSQDIKLIVTERWQQPSMMPPTFANYLNPTNSAFLPELQGLIGPNDFMTWTFYFGSTEQDPNKVGLENMVFMFAMNPDHIKTMMDNLQDIPDDLVAALKADPRNVLLGKERIDLLNKKVGESIKAYCVNYKGIDLEFHIVGELPVVQYSQIGIMNEDYFNKAMDNWSSNPANPKKEARHPLDQRRLNLIWLRVRDKDAVAKAASIIDNSVQFADRPVKCETLSSGYATFLDPYRDLLWAVKWLLVPAILVSMTLVVSNAIAITVRERRTEMAVLKVLGFRPLQIQVLVLGEALLVGCLSGLAATGGTIAIVNWVFGGIAFPIGWFPAFRVPPEALAWGVAIGGATGFFGSFLPAWTARSVKVSEVFSKVA